MATISDWMKERLQSWLDIVPATGTLITITEPFTYEMSVYKNQLWYRGDPAELHQFYTQSDDGVNNTIFWKANSSTGIRFRKIHTGLPALVVDVLVDIIISDLIGVELKESVAQKRWDEIAEDNNIEELLKVTLRKVMVDGDGAFKVSYDPAVSKYPIIEFYSGPRVRYEIKRGRVVATIFITRFPNPKNKRDVFVLEERYSKEGITYHLFDKDGDEVSLSTIPELADYKNAGNPHEFSMAIPFQLEASSKWPNRGKSLFDGKSGAFDSFDEVWSQWMDSLRDGRTTKYIPQTLVPRNPETGAELKPNSFDNRYVQSGSDMSENGKNEIRVVSGDVPHDALLASYTTALDLCLQGLISPSTLGIDVKKLDNAEAQREKEKATLYTRNKIIGALEKVIPKLVAAVLMTDDMLQEQTPGEYTASVSFGEYANPSFEAQVETIGKARTSGIMSIERAVDELYGDSLTDDEKSEEVVRLKDEQGVIEPDNNPEVEREPLIADNPLPEDAPPATREAQ